ncbi:MAG: dihydroneopterin aldolase [Bacteroidaceae bacterium]|nr:dihydroneopterin aldolase [Bacteroidaceae bacterium]
MATPQHHVIIEGLRLYAYHGAMAQERKVGAYFTIDADIATDFSYAIETDKLRGTINYADILAIIKREMAIPSRLVEHVTGRIAHAILAECPTAQTVHLKILKENPPMGSDCRGAGVEITLSSPALPSGS